MCEKSDGYNPVYGYQFNSDGYSNPVIFQHIVIDARGNVLRRSRPHSRDTLLFHNDRTHISVSADNQRLAYVIRKECSQNPSADWQCVITEDENNQVQETKTYRSIHSPTLRSTDTSILFAASNNDKYSVINGSRISNQHQFINDIVTSPNEEQVAYATSKNLGNVYETDQYDSSIVVNSDETKLPSNFQARNLIFSPDSKSLAYIVYRAFREPLDGNYKLEYVVVNDQEGDHFDRIFSETLQFSPDGKYLIYGAQQDKELWWVAQSVNSHVKGQ